MNSFDLDYTLGIFPILLKYIDITLTMALISGAIALGIAIIIAIVKTFAIKGLTQVFNVYLSFFLSLVHLIRILPLLLAYLFISLLIWQKLLEEQ